MIWVILAICVALGFLFIMIDCPEVFGLMVALSVLVIIAAIVLTTMNVNGRVIDAKIEMYTEENRAIEESINALVTEYMAFESKTFGDLKGESAITLISLYPELKSDELVKTQIEIYRANNDKIKSLKESRLNLSTVKWWLNFGS